jgi:hypothetical protein
VTGLPHTLGRVLNANPGGIDGAVIGRGLRGGDEKGNRLVRVNAM